MWNAQQTLKKGLCVYYVASVGYTTLRLGANGIDPRAAFGISLITAPIGVAHAAGQQVYLGLVKPLTHRRESS